MQYRENTEKDKQYKIPEKVSYRFEEKAFKTAERRKQTDTESNLYAEQQRNSKGAL